MLEKELNPAQYIILLKSAPDKWQKAFISPRSLEIADTLAGITNAMSPVLSIYNWTPGMDLSTAIGYTVNETGC